MEMIRMERRQMQADQADSGGFGFVHAKEKKNCLQQTDRCGDFVTDKKRRSYFPYKI